ncbi:MULTISPECIES: DUF6927 domain-containing protein [unclassified Roseovarius]|uniref:DUF6927 domain-containing protein n=1 Tax=unclassified Roseovarius TaxID=2614913 RepID=UPI00125318FA|nr:MULTISPECIES: hypothetical protein [unclassified Roseovarius]VVT33725.1 conserved hypothetical protein [Roseovarius sp. EC-SD190]
MGWLFNNRVPSNIRAEIERLCTHDDEERSTRTVRICRDGSIWTVAVEMTVKNGSEVPDGYQSDENGKFTFGAVFRTRKEYGGWGYRLDEETVGPEFARAPKSLIDLLSPTTSDWANRWRRRCLENAARRARRFKDGDVIKLEEALEFNDGRKRLLFRVIREKPPGYTRARTVFQCVETGVTCRISRFRRRAWDVMSPVGDPAEAKAATRLDKDN